MLSIAADSCGPRLQTCLFCTGDSITSQLERLHDVCTTLNRDILVISQFRLIQYEVSYVTFAGPLTREWSVLAGLSTVDLSYNDLTGRLLPRDMRGLLLLSLSYSFQVDAANVVVQVHCLPAGQTLQA